MVRLLLIPLLLVIPVAAACQETNFHAELNAIIDSGHYVQAVHSADMHLHENPYDHYVYKLRGTARKYLKGMEEAAITDLNIYLEYFPDDREAIFDRAILRYEAEKYNMALEDFKNLSRNNEFFSTNTIYFQHSGNSNTGTRIFTVHGGTNSLFHYYTGSCYYKLNQADSAIQFYDSALAGSNNNPDYYVARALAWEKLNNNEKAIADYHKAIMLNPEYSLAKSNLGNLLNRLGNVEEAEKYFQESIDDQPELAYPYAERAFNYLQTRYYRKALEEYNKAIFIDPSNVSYLINRGKTHLQLHNFKAAESDFRKVIALKPDDEQAYFNLAIVAYKNARFVEAEELLGMAIFYYPDYANAYYNRAIVLQKLNMYDEACADVRKAISLGMKVPADMISKLCN